MGKKATLAWIAVALVTIALLIGFSIGRTMERPSQAPKKIVISGQFSVVSHIIEGG